VRVAFAIVAWLFVAAIVVQVFLAGVGLFVLGFDTFSYHRALGWLLHLAPIVLILFAWGAHPGRTTMWLCAAILVLVGIQPFLPAMRGDLPFIAALHPVNALTIFGLGLVVAFKSTALARSPQAAPESSTLIPETPRN
jgi:hypothetical protein